MSDHALFELTLLNVQKERFEYDDDGVDFERILNYLKKTRACSAFDYHSDSSQNAQTNESSKYWNDLSNQMMKYVKIEDRYLSLASLLLKSLAFHNSQVKLNVGSSLPTKIVVLPRTKYNKPYIPPRSRIQGDSVASMECAISLSHQYPFVGIVRSIMNADRERKVDLNLGFDIVVFDPINPRMYQNVQEFVDVFAGSFSPNEWAAINDRTRCPNEKSQLRELYLRWTIKEAYTKALGIGMGFNFASFETSLDCLEDYGGVWKWLDSNLRNEHGIKYLRSMATIRQLAGTAEKNSTTKSRHITERWRFHFYPLYDQKDNEISKLMLGCGCICDGPIGDEQTNYSLFLENDLRINWTCFDSLSSFHTQQHI